MLLDGEGGSSMSLLTKVAVLMDLCQSSGYSAVDVLFKQMCVHCAVPFYSVLVSISVSMALSTVFHSTNSPDNSPFSDPVLPFLFISASLVLSTIYLFMKVFFTPDMMINSG